MSVLWLMMSSGKPGPAPDPAVTNWVIAAAHAVAAGWLICGLAQRFGRKHRKQRP